MDEVTQIGDERILRRVASEWREVCRWDEGPTPVSRHEALEIARGTLEKAERERLEVVESEAGCDGDCSWPDAVLIWRQNAESFLEAFDNMAVAFEELAGEHRALEEAFFHDAEVLSTPCPGDPADYIFVLAYYRPRRSRASNQPLGSPDPTEDTTTAPASDPGASGGPTAAQQMDRLLPKSGEETPGNWYNTDLLEEVGRMGDIPGYLSAQPEERSE